MQRLQPNENAVWYPEPPSSLDEVNALQAGANFTLPADYLNFLRVSNGGEGGEEAGSKWLNLWHTQEVIALNKDYQVQKYLPAMWGFGSDGGGTLFAFDADNKICSVPFGDFGTESVLVVASDFASFISGFTNILREK